MKIADRIGAFWAGAAAFPSVWILMSWIDVICHNVTDYTYASWNLFRLLF